jgi:formylglycine-generating enzyme required for sulfatase activity/flavodoxin
MFCMLAASCNAQPDNNGMLLIEGGTFQMGSPTSEYERDADEVLHEVTVGSFYMSETEVSQKQYEVVMGTNPSERKGENLPVENVTWYDAVRFCNALSEREGLAPCYTVNGTTVTWNRNADGYRLPTEAEWEYAARANTSTPFWFGDYVYDKDANCYNAYGYNNDASGHWVNGYLRHTVEVDKYNSNAFGLKNMHGNVAEWTWDWYRPSPDPTEKGDEESSYPNPTGPETGIFKVVRGGGWNDFPKHIRSAYRSAFPADVPLYATGIRLVRNATAGTGEVKSIYNNTTKSRTGKILIAYFSQTGNTDGLAKVIQQKTGYDMVRIERAVPYSYNYNGAGLYGEALDEYRSNAVPELASYVSNLADYDIILLGYCNWWASIPAPVRSFLMHDDFSGKTIVPFCSMGGGRFGQTISAIAKLASNSVILRGLDVEYTDYDDTRINQWLEAVKQYQTTGISSVKVNAKQVNGIFNLNGQKAIAQTKGIYIIDGEKRITK